jgi:hypothetical protein
VPVHGPTAAYRIYAGTGTIGYFGPDAYYTGGGLYTVAQNIDTAGVVNAAPMAVYQTQRYGNFSSSIPGQFKEEETNKAENLSPTSFVCCQRRQQSQTAGRAYVHRVDPSLFEFADAEHRQRDCAPGRVQRPIVEHPDYRTETQPPFRREQSHYRGTPNCVWSVQ